MAIDVDGVIERLGGPEAAARLTGVGTEAVRKWRQAGSIPSRHWAAVIAATGLSLSDLSPDVNAPRPEALPGAAPEPPTGASTCLRCGDRKSVV